MEAYLIKHKPTGKYLMYDPENGLMIVGDKYINYSLWTLEQIKHLFENENYYDNDTPNLVEVKKNDFEVYKVSIVIKEKITI